VYHGLIALLMESRPILRRATLFIAEIVYQPHFY